MSDYEICVHHSYISIFVVLFCIDATHGLRKRLIYCIIFQSYKLQVILAFSRFRLHFHFKYFFISTKFLKMTYFNEFLKLIS